MRVVCFVVLLCAFVYADNGPIGTLPGLATQPSFKQYSGYINVNESAGRSYFFWLAESQQDPSSDPLVLWLTGGPGCSSLGALFTENGPFIPTNNSTLEVNEYSWNRVANVLWLESPAGVGFSYSNTTSDYNVGDVRTANDSYTFLLKFLEQYPQYASLDFWITGESYGGHYVPELAERIVNGNAAGGAQINLKGFMAGNPWTYMPIDNLGAITDWWTHAIIPHATFDLINDNCNLSAFGPLMKQQNHQLGTEWVRDMDACINASQLASEQMGDIDIYDIYVDVCHASQAEYEIRQLARAGSIIHSMLLPKQDKPGMNISACVNSFVEGYLNIPDVQKAINALPTTWYGCSPNVNYSYTDVEKSVIPVYEFLFKQGLQILVYSGDVDAIVPYPGTYSWVRGFNQTIINDWTPWEVNQQVGGYHTQYQYFNFTTVRNAGHMVPMYQPARAFHMYNSTLNGECC